MKIRSRVEFFHEKFSLYVLLFLRYVFYLKINRHHQINQKIDMSWIQQLFWSFILTIAWLTCKSETTFSGHSRVIDVDHFLEVESAMISKIRNYIFQERKRLTMLKVNLNVWKKWQLSYFNKESEYLAIPQNIFHLFKKLTMNLDQFEKTMMKNSFGDTMMPDDIQPPTAQHLKQVVQSLINFQYFYSLEPQQIMNGTFMGLQLNTSLPLDSCYFIGKTCFELNEHADASDWLKAYLSLSADDEEHRKKVNKLLYPSYIFLDYVYDAFIAASNYLKDDPHNIPATDAVLDLSLQLGKLNSYGLSSIETHRLCRGEYDAKSAVAQLNLKCRYKHDGSAFLKIAPLKEEELYNDPKILLYREVLYDSEIEKMKAWAAQNLNVATVVARSGQSEKAFNYRISETGFMPNQSPEFSNLYKRIEDISEFHLQVGEMWQFLGYMPGGHYAMHSDYLPDKDNTVQSYGNREISMLFYLNEVSLGGETVFTRLRLAVKPIRGAAILWYNLQADGSYNYKTDHCACPVIIGEKWGFTQWIRSKDQQCLRQIFENNSTKKFSQTNKILKNLN